VLIVCHKALNLSIFQHFDMYVAVVQYNSYHNLRPASVEITGFPDYYNSLGRRFLVPLPPPFSWIWNIVSDIKFKVNVIYRWCLNACVQYTAKYFIP